MGISCEGFLTIAWNEVALVISQILLIRFAVMVAYVDTDEVVVTFVVGFAAIGNVAAAARLPVVAAIAVKVLTVDRGFTCSSMIILVEVVEIYV